MFRIIIAALILFAPVAAASASPACSGAGPGIVSVAVNSVSSDGNLNRYDIRGTVVNGSAAQASSVLQFVDIYKGSEKLDSKGIPPLQPGQSYSFEYVSTRSHDAGSGSTKLTFRLDPAGTPGCNARRSVTF